MTSTIAESTVEDAALDDAFRKLARPEGPTLETHNIASWDLCDMSNCLYLNPFAGDMKLPDIRCRLANKNIGRLKPAYDQTVQCTSDLLLPKLISGELRAKQMEMKHRD